MASTRCCDSYEVENSSEWSLTMVTREPADRFLSGFIDRCLRTAKYTKRASTDHHDFMTPNTTVVDNHIFPQNWLQIQNCLPDPFPPQRQPLAGLGVVYRLHYEVSYAQ
ncbi:hypothetical protein OSTOST_15223, partial [Ostertagia ostertagi]